MTFLFFTGSARPDEQQAAIDAGASAYLVKPGDLDRLTATAKRLLGAERIIKLDAATQITTLIVTRRARTGKLERIMVADQIGKARARWSKACGGSSDVLRPEQDGR